MSEWDKLCKDWLALVNIYYFKHTQLRQLYYDIKTEGDKLQAKADFADSVYEMAQCCIANQVPMFHGNIYEGLITKYISSTQKKIEENSS